MLDKPACVGKARRMSTVAHNRTCFRICPIAGA